MSRLDKAIVIVGAISSGKSTVAKQISDRTKIQIASFGGFLKDHCLRHNLPSDRKNLQDVGEVLIQTQPEKLLFDVMDFSGKDVKSFIFEGVRHIAILDLLKKHSKKILSIFIDVPYDERRERYLLRNNDIDSKKSFAEFELANSHPVELEIPILKNYCNLTISSFDDSSFDRISSFVKE